MGRKKVETYIQRSAEDRKIASRFELAYFEDWLQSLPPKERDKKRLVIGPRTYSAQDILEEIRKESEDAEMFRTFLKQVRMASTRAGKR
jgi:hypothetical protein